ncbi:MAG TPA: cobalamin-binding protein [Candidatus Cloacimonadota bacterium]|nr:cobalamin-binding protein [Candidatus Cloacimonadota bacterium]HPT73244.1 cobalamin-binding protein [Candidatus Cloacimonadota bacterium]
MKELIIILISFILLCSCTPKKKITQPRYVITSPEVAEIIAFIDGTHQIVGVTDECTFPASLKSIPRVGKFGAIDKEKILNLKPTMVFTSGLEQASLASELNKLSIPTYVYYPKTMNDMINDIREIGEKVDAEKNANALADSLKEKIEGWKKDNLGVKRPRVFLEIYHEPLMSVSNQSFVGQVIDLAGGNNIFPMLERDYARVKAEDVITRDPNVIISFSEIPVKDIRNRRGWEKIDAVKNNRIYLDEDINPDLILRAGPRVMEGVEKLHTLLYGNNAKMNGK